MGDKTLRRKINLENGQWARILPEGDGFMGTSMLSICESLKIITTLKKKFQGQYFVLFKYLFILFLFIWPRQV